MSSTCPKCGKPSVQALARFCTFCGAAVEPPEAPAMPVMGPPTIPLQPPLVTPATYWTTPQAPPLRTYAPGLINTCRLLSAACILSAFLAVMNLDTRSTPGRVLIVSSIAVSVLGQLFAMQASKPSPPAWAGTVLTFFFLGLSGLPVLWLILWP